MIEKIEVGQVWEAKRIRKGQKHRRQFRIVQITRGIWEYVSVVPVNATSRCSSMSSYNLRSQYRRLK